MKTLSYIPTRFIASSAVVLDLPIQRGARPVRRGNFWPGENFGACTSKWDLTGAFADHAYVLPALSGGKDPRTL